MFFGAARITAPGRHDTESFPK